MHALERITQTLEAEFAPESLDVVDESHKHAGHAGAPEGGESHFRVTMVSQAFSGMNKVERQRAVYKALQAEFDARLHALAFDGLWTPAEYHDQHTGA